MAMMLRTIGLESAGDKVEEAVMQVTPKLKSMSAGNMGYSTGEVGDLVCKALTVD